MKNSFVIAFTMLLGAAANAQTTTPTQTQPVAPPTDTTTASATILVDSSIGKAYVSHPERLQGLTTETLTTAHIFPILGTYKGNGTSTTDVTITLDETNKGMVWVDGLPQGRFKALMKKAPSTYKIPAQKSESGQAVAEGTLYLDPETNALTIISGQSFNDANPTAFLSAPVKKFKGWQYTGVKADAPATTATPSAPSQQ
jgi:hypothetical protein